MLFIVFIYIVALFLRDNEESDKVSGCNQEIAAGPSKGKRPWKPKPAQNQKGKQGATGQIMPQEDWQDSGEKDAVSPRKFNPRKQPGFQLPTTLEWSSLSLFSLFLSSVCIETIVKNTNEYPARL